MVNNKQFNEVIRRIISNIENDTPKEELIEYFEDIVDSKRYKKRFSIFPTDESASPASYAAVPHRSDSAADIHCTFSHTDKYSSVVSPYYSFTFLYSVRTRFYFSSLRSKFDICSYSSHSIWICAISRPAGHIKLRSNISSRGLYRVTRKWHISTLKLLFVEANNSFNVPRSREQVKRRYFITFPTVLSQYRRVTGKGLGIA